MAFDAALFREERLPVLWLSRRDVHALRPSTSTPDIGQEVGNVGSLEGRAGNLQPLHCHGHWPSTVPEGSGQEQRGRVPAVLVEPRAHAPAFASQRVAGLASFLAEDAGPGRRIAGRIQRAEVVEKGEQACHLPRLEPGAGNPFFLEDVLHRGRVIPHVPSDLEERAVQDPSAQIGSRGSSHSMDGVTAETPLAGKEPAPLQGICGEQNGETLVAGEGRTDCEPQP